MNQSWTKWEHFFVYFLLATTPFVISPVTADSYLLPKITWLSLWGALWLFIVWIQSPTSKQRTPLDFPLAALVCLVCGSILIDYHSPNQIVRLILLILYIGFFYAFRRYWSMQGCVFPVTRVLLITLTLLALYALAQDYGYDVFQNTGGVRDWRAKVIATIGNPNFLSGYLLIGLPVLIGYALQQSASWKRFLISLFAITIIIACHTVTFCVGSTIGIIGSLLVLCATLIYLRKKPILPKFRTALLILCALSSIGWYMLPNPYNSHGGSLLVEAMQSPQWYSGTGARKFNWRTTAYMIHENPFTGIGYGNYIAKHLHYQGINYQIQDHPHDRDYVVIVDQPHFLLLEFASEMGPLGVFILIWLLIAWTKRALHQLRHDDNQWFAWGAYAGCWVAIIHSFASFPFHLPANAFLFVALSSYLIKTKRISPPNPALVSNPKKILYFTIALIIAGSAFCRYTSNQFLRLSYESEGMDSIIHLQSANQLNPFDPQVHLMLGVRYIQYGWYDRAKEELYKTIALQEDLQAHKYLTRIYQEQNNLPQAIHHQRRVLELNAAYPGHYRELATLLRQVGNQEEANTLESKADELTERLNNR